MRVVFDDGVPVVVDDAGRDVAIKLKGSWYRRVQGKHGLPELDTVEPDKAETYEQLMKLHDVGG